MTLRTWHRRLVLPTGLILPTCCLLAGLALRRDLAPRWTDVEPGAALSLTRQAPALPTMHADGSAYAIARDDREPSTFVARNPAHGFAIAFTEEGAQIAAASPLTLRLTAFGREGQREAVRMSGWRPDGARIERTAITRAMSEWYVNGPFGLEQGFTVVRPPPGVGRLTIELTLDRPWEATVTRDTTSVRLLNRRQGTALHYRGLHAFDAAGRALAAQVMPSAQGLLIAVDGDDARYPITIDPFIQEDVLTAFDAEPFDGFGDDVAVSDNTVIVGAPQRESQRGAAYVYVRSASGWSLQAKLIPNDPRTGGLFGIAVDIDGDTAIVGALRGGDGSVGAAYVFTRSGTVWSQQAKLTGTGDVPADFFGRGVAVEGNTAVVGSSFNFTTPGQTQPGSVYVFVRSGTTWTLQQEIAPAFALPGDGFGNAVALSGETLIAGAPGDDLGAVQDVGTAYVFVRTGAQWSFQQALAPPMPSSLLRFGATLDLSGNRALVGGSGRQTTGSGLAAAYGRAGSTWSLSGQFQNARLLLGIDVSLEGNAGVIGAAGNIASIFVTVVRFPASGPPVTEEVPSLAFGRSVAIDGPTVAVGAFASPGFVEVLGEIAGAPTPPVVAPPVVSGSTVDLSWTASAGATRYQLRAGTFPGGSNAFNGDVGNVTTLKAVNVPNGSYFIRVFAVNASGESAASNEVRADVGVPGPCTPPAAPANLTRGVNGSLVTLTWSASTGATSYVVEAGSASGLANLAVIDTGSAIPSFAASAPPGIYFVRVRAKNSCGLSGVSNQVTVTVG